MTLQEAETHLMKLGPGFRIQLLVLVILCVGTLLMGAQRRTIENNYGPQLSLTDGIQDERIAGLTARINLTDLRLAELNRQQTETQSSVDRIVGLGVGFGTLLAIIQGSGVVLQWRQGKK